MNNDIKFLLKIGTALQVLGMDAPRLESALSFLATKLNIQADFFSTPTSLMVAINNGDHQEHFFKRTEPGEIHLEKLSRINEIGNKVCAGQLSTTEALREVENLDHFTERYSKHFINFCFGLSAAFIAIFIGGNLATAAAAFGIGTLVGTITLYKAPLHIHQVSDVVATFVASFLAYGVGVLFPSVYPATVILASILVIIPGVMMTIAISELAAQHLVSGTSRFMLSLMIFFKMAFGVALAIKLFSLLGLQFTTETFSGYQPIFRYLGLILASLTLSILFLAPPRDAVWISLSCVVSYMSANFGQEYLGPYLGLMIGGCSVAVGSNLFTKVFNRPILITMLPGILVLVPGALGFQSLNYMYQHDLLLGIDTAFSTIATVVSLVAGIFIGNLILKTKQHF